MLSHTLFFVLQHDQLPGIAEGQRPQQHRAHRAEDGDSRSERDGERENGHRCHRRALAQHPQREFEILQHGQSARSAEIGSTCVARSAGIKLATSETRVSTAARAA